jgi:hypothetical protein
VEYAAVEILLYPDDALWTTPVWERVAEWDPFVLVHGRTGSRPFVENGHRAGHGKSLHYELWNRRTRTSSSFRGTGVTPKVPSSSHSSVSIIARSTRPRAKRKPVLGAPGRSQDHTNVNYFSEMELRTRFGKAETCLPPNSYAASNRRVEPAPPGGPVRQGH